MSTAVTNEANNGADASNPFIRSVNQQKNSLTGLEGLGLAKSPEKIAESLKLKLKNGLNLQNKKSVGQINLN